MTYIYTFDDRDLMGKPQPTAEDRPVVTIQNIFIKTPEDMSLEEYVLALYWFILKRIPSDQEVNEWCERITNGCSHHDAAMSFLGSDEATELAPHIQFVN